MATTSARRSTAARCWPCRAWPVPSFLWKGEDLGLTAVVFIPEATGATWAARAALPNEVPIADAALNLATAAGLAIGLKTADHG